MNDTTSGFLPMGLVGTLVLRTQHSQILTEQKLLLEEAEEASLCAMNWLPGLVQRCGAYFYLLSVPCKSMSVGSPKTTPRLGKR